MDVFCEDLIFTNMEFATQQELFEFAGQQLCLQNRAENPAQLVSCLLHREGEFSTYMENGVSIPHCKSPHVFNTSVVVIKTQQGILWDEEGSLADLAILLAVPEKDAGNAHLRLLALLSQQLMDDGFVTALKGLASPSEIYQYLIKGVAA